MTMETENALQEQLLKRLTDYGDSVLESEFKAKKRKKKGKVTGDVEDNSVAKVTNTSKAGSVRDRSTDANTHSQSVIDTQKRKKKKKKKKGVKNQTDVNERPSTTEKLDTETESTKKTLTGPKKHMETIVGQLGLKQFKSDLEKRVTQAEIITGIKGTSKKEPEVIVFNSQKYGKPKDNTRQKADPQETDGSGKFDIKVARFEVRKFGLAGFHGEVKEKAITDLLVRLGAKPKKKAFVNYKELQEQRKDQIMAEEQKRDLDRQMGLNVDKKKNSKRPRDKNDIGPVDGQVGKFRRGVQFIKPNDVQGIKKSKLKVK